jgi:DNA polymerase-3 subunit beta
MRFVCTQENLLEGLARVVPLSGRNTQLPVLQHVLLETREGVLYLTCTDLEVGARAVVAGKAESEGSCTVTARQLLDFVQQLPSANPVTIENKKKRLAVTTKGFDAQFPVAPADDFPLLPSRPKARAATLDGRLFCQALEQTMFAAARDESRPEIHSVFVQGEEGGIRVVGTDSFRLAEYVVSLPQAVDFSFLLPVDSAGEVSRLFADSESLEILRAENYVVFQNERLYVSSRLVDGSYPDYRQIIPSSFAAEGAVRRDEFLRALKILSVFLPRDSRRIAVAVNPEKSVLQLRAEGSESGQGEVTLPFEGRGKALDALFNVTYLIDGATHGGGESVVLKFAGKSDPVMMSPSSENMQHLYLVMPIQA